MAWCTGIAFCLMAIEGDSNYPNLQGLINQNMQKLQDGWLDTISPDGSVDEAYGYANYGNMYSMNAGVAAINCGYGDWMAGTNVLRVPRWLTASTAGGSFPWIGDSSPTHKGDRIDPVCYYPLTRADAADPASLWGLNRIMLKEAPGDATPSQAWSPHVHRSIYYPSGLSEQAPEVLSGFFRDNLNQGNASGNKLIAYPEVGAGGHAFMHNATDPTWSQMAALYMIRDEWMTHGHEDDGHFSLSVDGEWAFLDMGYANQSGWQVTDVDLHGQVAQLLARRTPRFGVGLVRRREGSPRPHGDDAAGLDGLLLHRAGREKQADFRTVLAFLGFDEDAITDDEELFLAFAHHVQMGVDVGERVSVSLCTHGCGRHQPAIGEFGGSSGKPVRPVRV